MRHNLRWDFGTLVESTLGTHVKYVRFWAGVRHGRLPARKIRGEFGDLLRKTDWVGLVLRMRPARPIKTEDESASLRETGKVGRPEQLGFEGAGVGSARDCARGRIPCAEKA